jgi:signal peptidase I
MEPSIMAGDYIIVNKQIPGPRVYLHFPHLLGEDGRIATKRFKGIRPIRRNDVIVFNFPYSDWNRLDFDVNVNYVKRCVAIPGDTFYIENGIYKVKNCPDALGCTFRQEELSKKTKEELRGIAWDCFPNDKMHYWNIKDFGPLYVPKKSDDMAIDTVNCHLYGKLITYETGKPLVSKDGLVFLGDSLITHYVFELNYYFMAGDLIFDSKDSRYWGLLPEDHIVGKAIIIWKSKDQQTDKRNWKRYFKIIK